MLRATRLWIDVRAELVMMCFGSTGEKGLKYSFIWIARAFGKSGPPRVLKRYVKAFLGIETYKELVSKNASR
jgi:hypothetical protein